MRVMKWTRYDSLLQSSARLELDNAHPPTTPVAGGNSRSIPSAGLREAQAIHEAFAAVGWDVHEGHDSGLTCVFNCDGIPTSLSFSFDEDQGCVRTWVSAIALVRRDLGEPLSPTQLDFLGVVMALAEDPFPGSLIPLNFDRSVSFRGVSQQLLPRPFAQVVADKTVLVSTPNGMRHKAYEPPVGNLVVGYHWKWIADGEARRTVITHATDKLPRVLKAIRDLSLEDPLRFQEIMGVAIPSLQLADRWDELNLQSPVVEPERLYVKPVGVTVRFCTGCGQQRVKGASFCGDCGNAFGSVGDDAAAGINNAPSALSPASNTQELPLSSSSRELAERLAVQGDSLAMYILAFDAEARGDLDGARRWREMSANAGNSDAMTLIALKEFQAGNMEAFVFWAKRGAEAGHLQALTILGTYAVNQRDWFEARTWLEPAAAAGDSTAKVYLGMVERANGNPDRARELFASAAEDGDSAGMYELGLEAHLIGEDSVAYEWWLRAASDDNAEAMFSLGSIAWKAEQLNDAAAWFERAADLGHVNAMWRRALVAERLEGQSARRLWDERAAAEGHPHAQNFLGAMLVEEGRTEEGLALLAASARQGFPWALASYSWALIKAGAYQRALELGEEVLGVCERFIQDEVDDPEILEIGPEQLANAKSNHALCLLAVGGLPATAERMWIEGVPSGHLESRFFPAVLHMREGRLDQAQTQVVSLNPDERLQIRNILEDLRSHADQWLTNWCDDGLALLQSASSTKSTCHNCEATLSLSAHFCPMCGCAVSQ